MTTVQGNGRRSKLANASGFIVNATLFDGTTWQPEENLNGDTTKTMYRNHFNREKPFHKSELRENNGRLKRATLTYEH